MAVVEEASEQLDGRARKRNATATSKLLANSDNSPAKRDSNTLPSSSPFASTFVSHGHGGDDNNSKDTHCSSPLPAQGSRCAEAPRARTRSKQIGTLPAGLSVAASAAREEARPVTRGRAIVCRRGGVPKGRSIKVCSYTSPIFIMCAPLSMQTYTSASA